MPRLPWTSRSTVEPDREYLVMASRLPLARYRDLPAFLRGTIAVRRQLARADGLIGYTLDAHLLTKTFWTLSAWRDEQALDAFARGTPHDEIIDRIRPAMGPTTFVTWTEPSTGIPVPWSRAQQRVLAASDDR